MKIALITPYSGSNLGDAAIQEAVIYNIRKRHPDADIRLVTLYPQKTSHLHHVPSFPITSLTVPYYSSGRSPEKSDQVCNIQISPNGNGSAEKDLFTDVKVYLKKFPGLFSALKRVFHLLVKVVRFPAVTIGEISHFAEACSIMKGADIFIVSGGGQIDEYWGGPWGHPYSLFKWGLISKVVGARYVFLGVGTGTLDSELGKIFVRLALNFSTYRSFRDEGSKAILKYMLFTQGDVICPDLAYGFDRRRISKHERRTEKSVKTVGINIIAHMRQNMPRKDLTIYDYYLYNLSVFMKDIIRQGYSIVLFVTDSPDRHVFKELEDKFARSTSIDISGKINHICTNTVDDLFNGFANMDYVVASRLHAVLLAHLAKKPVLALSYERKVNIYMDEMNFNQYCFDINKFDVNFLKKSFDTMVIESDKIISKLHKIVCDYDSILDRQFDVVMKTSC